MDKFIEGAATAGTVKAAGLPNIKARVFTGVSGSISGNPSVWYTPAGSGAFSGAKTGMSVGLVGYQGSGNFNYSSDLTFDASRHNSIYKDDVSIVQPPALTMRYAIYTGNVGKYCWLRQS